MAFPIAKLGGMKGFCYILTTNLSCPTEAGKTIVKGFTIALLLISSSAFGQGFVLGSSVDSTFEKFSKRVFSLDRTVLGVHLEPASIVEVKSQAGDSTIKFELKYVHTVGNPPSFDEIARDMIGNESNYWCALFGTEYLVIGLFRNTGTMNDVKYYYQIINK